MLFLVPANFKVSALFLVSFKSGNSSVLSPQDSHVGNGTEKCVRISHDTVFDFVSCNTIFTCREMSGNQEIYSGPKSLFLRKTKI